MEPTRRNQWQWRKIDRPPKTRKQPTSVAVRCHRLPFGAHGKEGGRSFDRWDGFEQRPKRRPTHSSDGEPGQQTGSKRLKSASLNHAEPDHEKPEDPHE
jgi:hypothetical protein